MKSKFLFNLSLIIIIIVLLLVLVSLKCFVCVLWKQNTDEKDSAIVNRLLLIIIVI